MGVFAQAQIIVLVVVVAMQRHPPKKSWDSSNWTACSGCVGTSVSWFSGRSSRRVFSQTGSLSTTEPVSGPFLGRPCGSRRPPKKNKCRRNRGSRCGTAQPRRSVDGEGVALHPARATSGPVVGQLDHGATWAHEVARRICAVWPSTRYAGRKGRVRRVRRHSESTAPRVCVAVCGVVHEKTCGV